MIYTDPDTTPGGLLRDAGPLDDDAGPAGPLEDEAPARRQPGQLVEVLVEGEPLFTVRIVNRDRISYEKAAARHKEWPQGATSFTMTYLTWAAARREGKTTATFDRWQDILEDFDVIADAPADPTR